jgi:hypothetical protein
MLWDDCPDVARLMMALGNGHFLHAGWVHPHPVGPGSRDYSGQGHPGPNGHFLIAELTT